LFWLAGGQRYKPKADPGKDFGMIEVGRYTYRGTAAALLVNPDAATPLSLESSPGEPDVAVYRSALLPVHDVSLQLLLTPNEKSRADFTGLMQIELLAESGQVTRNMRVNSGKGPTILMLEPGPDPISVKVTLPSGEPAPVAWLMPAGVERP
jgi:hypothetical protein